MNAAAAPPPTRSPAMTLLACGHETRVPLPNGTLVTCCGRHMTGRPVATYSLGPVAVPAAAQ